MKEIIRVLSKTLNVADSELTSALMDGDKIKEGAESFLTDKFTSHYKSITDAEAEKRKKAEDDMKQKTFKETSEKFEKAIAEQIPGLDKTLKGDELLKQLPSAVNALRTVKEEPEKIKTSTTYMEGIKAAEERKDKEWQAKLDTATQEVDKLKAERNTDKVSTKIKGEVSKYLDTLSLRTDVAPEVISALKKSAQDNLLARASKLSETGDDVIFLDANGEAAKDKLGNTIKLSDLIKEAHEPLSKLTVASDDRGDGGKPGGDKGQGGAGAKNLQGFGLTPPKSVEEFDTLIAQVKELKSKGTITEDTLQVLVKEGQDSVLSVEKKA